MQPFEYKGSGKYKPLSGPLSAHWQSPSNIALVKYWGKTGLQLPVNPSLSMTLSKAFTETTLTVFPLENKSERSVKVYVDQVLNPGFEERISGFLDSISDIFPFIPEVSFKIDTRNTFPHSAGIASSASGFSALALCLCTLQEQLSGTAIPDFQAVASHVSRLGSGSACRSIYGGFTLWGNTPYLTGSDDRFAIPVNNIHPDFNTLRDAILIVGSGEKKVSSSAGHSRMENHPFAKARIIQAQNNIGKLLKAMEVGDIDTFISVTEQEALTLHALMMTSSPGFILMNPESVRIINRIQEFRSISKLNICFTLDAGPNIHLIFFEKDREQVHRLIVEDLLQNDKQNNWIDDAIGTGPFGS
ncbi:MAG: diphosphomevalonate decarboxylase [Bacteroidales bacterium]|nr:diphosphomevalonate decarboxylase [Bacteroidales bacterium]